MVSINQNIASLRVTRFLGAATSSLSRSFERLSSGQRINRASDDAAGVAIADSLRTRAKLYGAAGRNINDGISALNIASAALGEQSAILQRLSELAEQSANGTYSAAQRATANAEYESLVREFGRTGDTTSFNGISLLLAERGSNGSTINLQTGVDGRSSSGLSVTTANTGSRSGIVYASTVYGAGSSPLFGAFSTYEGICSDSQNQFLKAAFTDSSGRQRELLLTLYYDTNLSSYTLSVYAHNADIGPNGYAYGGEYTVQNQSDYLNVGNANVPVDATGKPTAAVSIGYSFDSETVSGSLSLDLSGLRFARSADAGPLQSFAGNVSGSTALEFTGIDTVGRSRTALTLIQAKLSELSSLQGQFGAAQSRLMSSLNVADVSKENSLAAESRIRDVDVADEAARLTSAQIKQQTAAQILAQANNQSAIALQLLRI